MMMIEGESGKEGLFSFSRSLCPFLSGIFGERATSSSSDGTGLFFSAPISQRVDQLPPDSRSQPRKLAINYEERSWVLLVACCSLLPSSPQTFPPDHRGGETTTFSFLWALQLPFHTHLFFRFQPNPRLRCALSSAS